MFGKFWKVLQAAIGVGPREYSFKPWTTKDIGKRYEPKPSRRLRHATGFGGLGSLKASRNQWNGCWYRRHRAPDPRFT